MYTAYDLSITSTILRAAQVDHIDAPSTDARTSPTISPTTSPTATHVHTGGDSSADVDAAHSVVAAVASPAGIEIFSYALGHARERWADHDGTLPPPTAAHSPHSPQDTEQTKTPTQRISSTATTARMAAGQSRPLCYIVDSALVAALNGMNLCAVALTPPTHPSPPSAPLHTASEERNPMVLAAAGRNGLLYFIEYNTRTRAHVPRVLHGHPGGVVQLVPIANKDIRVTEIAFCNRTCFAVCTLVGQVFVVERSVAPSVGAEAWRVTRCVDAVVTSAPGAWVGWLPCGREPPPTAQNTFVVIRCLAGRRTQLALCTYATADGQVDHGTSTCLDGTTTAHDTAAGVHGVRTIDLADELRGLGILSDGTCITVSNVGQLCLYAPHGSQVYTGVSLPPPTHSSPHRCVVCGCACV